MYEPSELRVKSVKPRYFFNDILRTFWRGTSFCRPDVLRFFRFQKSNINLGELQAHYDLTKDGLGVECRQNMRTFRVLTCECHWYIDFSCIENSKTPTTTPLRAWLFPAAGALLCTFAMRRTRSFRKLQGEKNRRKSTYRNPNIFNYTYNIISKYVRLYPLELIYIYVLYESETFQFAEDHGKDGRRHPGSHSQSAEDHGGEETVEKLRWIMYPLVI